MLTPEQLDELNRRGVTQVGRAITRATAATMAEAVWAALADRGIRRADPSTWPEGFLTKNQALRTRGVFEPFNSPLVVGVGDQLLGAGRWEARQGWGPALVTFPQPGPWRLPHQAWHFDLPGRGDPDAIPALRLFGFVGDVTPRGGGTLVVEGSHHLVRRLVAASLGHDAGRSSDLRKQLAAAHPWFKALLREGGADRDHQLMIEGDEIDGVRVRVTELTAAAGDIVVMHPWTMHNMSMNCLTAPRLAVTHTLYRT